MSDNYLKAPNPFDGVEKNTVPVVAAEDVNAAVARITGLKASVLNESEDELPDPQTAKAMQQNRGPESSAYGRDVDSVARPMPKSHKMPPKKAEQNEPGAEDEGDDEHDDIAQIPKGESRNRIHLLPEKQAYLETALYGRQNMKHLGLSGMDEWRTLAGLPMQEDAERGTGKVPTAGATKQNSMKGGLPGLEGTPMSPLKAQPYGDNGDDAENTMDPHPGDLKKEEYDNAFAEYLNNKGVQPNLFAHMVDEAMQSEDVEEMEVLIRVEEDFKRFFYGRGN